MNAERIEQLLEKYWLCETTVAEEDELRRLFLREDVPAHLAKYKVMFELQEDESQGRLDERFDERILEMIGADEEKPVKKSFNLRPLLQLAASIALVLGLWFAIQTITQDHNDPWKQDTFETPEQALAEVQKVLFMVSGQMDRGQELVMQKVEKAEPLTNIIKK